MLANTKRFLEQLAESDTDSRRYVVRLKESLEHELRRGKLRTERGEGSQDALASVRAQRLALQQVANTDETVANRALYQS